VITHLLVTKRESYVEFITRRFFRLAPLLYFAIAMVFLLYAAFPSLYGKYVEHDPLWGHVIAHLTMLHGAVPQEVMKHAQFTLLSPAWSISLEWQFYLVAPAMLLLARRPVALIGVLSLIVIGSGMLRPILDGHGITLRGAFLPYSLKLFALGIASYFAFTAVRPVWNVPGCSIAAALLAYSFTEGYALTIWLVIFFAVCGDPVPRKALESRPMLWLGQISYSIYLLHMIALTAGKGLLSTAGLAPGNWQYFLLLAVITVGLTLPASALAYRFIEHPGTLFGQTIARRLRARRSPQRQATKETEPLLQQTAH